MAPPRQSAPPDPGISEIERDRLLRELAPLYPWTFHQIKMATMFLRHEDEIRTALDRAAKNRHLGIMSDIDTFSLGDRAIPEPLAKMPRHGLLPIPFVTHVDQDGKPDFRVLDQGRVLVCAQHRLCGLCGESLEYWLVWIGSQRELDRRIMSDPPMHDACAHYALVTCPHLSRPHSYREMSPEEMTARGVDALPGPALENPGPVIRAYTRDYKMGQIDRSLVFLPARWHHTKES